jgi:hypothetical protein
LGPEPVVAVCDDARHGVVVSHGEVVDLGGELASGQVILVGQAGRVVRHEDTLSRGLSGVHDEVGPEREDCARIKGLIGQLCGQVFRTAVIERNVAVGRGI